MRFLEFLIRKEKDKWNYIKTEKREDKKKKMKEILLWRKII